MNTRMKIESSIEKRHFEPNLNRDDGLVLQIHHTVPKLNNEQLRIRFTHAEFHPFFDQLCACDHHGNIFIINLCSNKYWILSTTCVCTALGFVPHKSTLVLLGSGHGILTFVHTEIGKKMGKLVGHRNAVKHISFSTEYLCLTASEIEAIVWDLKSNSQVHRLSMDQDSTVKYVSFIPVSNNILSCFQNDIMHVWKNKTFQPIKQILPAAWKSRHLQSIAFTRNGRAMVIGGRSQTLVVFSVDNWQLDRVINLPDSIRGVRQLEFVPQLFDGGANKILGILSSHHTFHLYDIEENMFLKKTIEPRGGIVKFVCSYDGKYVACILSTGEVNIYCSVKLFDIIDEVHEVRVDDKVLVRPKPIRRFPYIQKEATGLLSRIRLAPILKKYGEYPETYRALIWKTILKTPHNEQAFKGLASRGCHPAFDRLDKLYPLENKLMLKNLQRILSLMANWCPLFSQIKSLPLFVFPFVQIFNNDPLTNFEVICTVIVNWCQHWFQYFPFPPINIMAIIENIMAERDPELLNHMNSKGITSGLYAWSLLETAFSEVFTKHEWLQFWDHIISNEPSLLILAVIAYNITLRTTLLSCNIIQEFEYFYHNQNPINMKIFLSKCYLIMDSTAIDIHPKQYLKNFKKLEKGTYPIFTEYPKEILDHKAEQILKYKEEEDKITKEEIAAVKNRAAQLNKLKEQIRQEENDARLRNLELVYKKSLNDEQERIAQRRKQVSILNMELHDREIQIIEAAKNRMLRLNTEERTAALQRSLDDLDRNRALEESNETFIEENIIRHNRQLMIQKNNLEKVLRLSSKNNVAIPIEHQMLKKEQQKLTNELHQLREDHSANNHIHQLTLATRIAAVDNMLQQVEVELAKEMADRQDNLLTNHSHLKTIELECVTKQLEYDVSALLESLASTRIQETQFKIDELAKSVMDRQTFAEEEHQLINAVHAYSNYKPVFEERASSSLAVSQNHDFIFVTDCQARALSRILSSSSSCSSLSNEPEVCEGVSGIIKKNRKRM